MEQAASFPLLDFFRTHRQSVGVKSFFFAQSRARQHYAACRVSTEIHQLIIHHSTCSRRVRFDVVCRLQHTSDSGGMSCSSSCLASEDRIRKVGKLETASCGSEFDNFGNVVCLLTQVRTTEAHHLPPCVPNALHLFAKGEWTCWHLPRMQCTKHEGGRAGGFAICPGLTSGLGVKSCEIHLTRA